MADQWHPKIPPGIEQLYIKGFSNMKRTLLFLLISILTITTCISQPVNYICEQALPFCGSIPNSFPAGTGAYIQQTGPYYSCLVTVPNPTWYYLKAATSGSIDITIVPAPLHDIDFVLWGPFDSQNACQLLTSDKVISCSYSTLQIEDAYIPSAIAGKYYVLVVTNFSNQACTLSFSQNFGSGTTDCSLMDCNIGTLTANPGSCSPTTNQFSVSGSVSFINPPTSGTLLIKDITSEPVISQIYYPPFISPLSYNLSNITCDGANHTITASFSASLNCIHSQQAVSPSAVDRKSVV